MENEIDTHMAISGDGYFQVQTKVGETDGGAQGGDAGLRGTGGDGSRQPSENELAAARYQGRVIAETAKKLHG